MGGLLRRTLDKAVRSWRAARNAGGDPATPPPTTSVS
jgi:hypothetical protein